MNGPVKYVPKFRPDIQGLRAIAVTGVVVYHASSTVVPGGYTGVDMFFVISGFLITSHLLSEHRKNGKIALSVFYAKRIRRILPAAFVVIAASIVFGYFVVSPLEFSRNLPAAVASAFYVPNVLFAANGTDYLADASPSLFQHYWSLGIEEQFYLVWPLLLLLLWRFKGTRGRAFNSIVAALAALSFALCVVLTSAAQPLAFFLLPTRAWELAVGGLVALLLLGGRSISSGTVSAVGVWIGLGGLVCSFFLLGHASAFPGYLALLPVASTASVIFFGATNSSSAPNLVLGNRVFQYVGKISYSLYLVHWPLIWLADYAWPDDTPPVWRPLALIGLSVLLAVVLHRFVEVPFLAKTNWFQQNTRRPLLGAVSASLVVLLCAGGLGLVNAQRPLTSDQVAASIEPSAPPVAPDFVPANITPGLDVVAADNPDLYEDGCHRDFASVDGSPCVYGEPERPVVALFGDSHAAQWFPALYAAALEAGYTVWTFTKSSCPSIDAPILRDNSSYVACEVWRDSVLEYLQENPPEAVLLSNFGTVEFQSKGDFAVLWEAGLKSTIAQLPPATRSIVLADVPRMTASPAACLSSHLNDALECARDADSALQSPSRDADRRVGLSGGSVSYVDLTSYFCSDVCPAIIGASLVYRDAHQITATFSAHMSATLWNKLSLT
ncbi:acyltransferase family protein [Pseudoclavibacter terrae]|uniref:acyltransferase family protein n=1 Tax=Pseudoclavibacter terrae TaxID=1530195 RepID=UPI00232E39AE|nr:acyltransferase family protein [Pseudoclavibacter terrae]